MKRRIDCRCTYSTSFFSFLQNAKPDSGSFWDSILIQNLGYFVIIFNVLSVFYFPFFLAYYSAFTFWLTLPLSERNNLKAKNSSFLWRPKKQICSSAFLIIFSAFAYIASLLGIRINSNFFIYICIFRFGKSFLPKCGFPVVNSAVFMILFCIRLEIHISIGTAWNSRGQASTLSTKPAFPT